MRRHSISYEIPRNDSVCSCKDAPRRTLDVEHKRRVVRKSGSQAFIGLCHGSSAPIGSCYADGDRRVGVGYIRIVMKVRTTDVTVIIAVQLDHKLFRTVTSFKESLYPVGTVQSARDKPKPVHKSTASDSRPSEQKY